MRISFLILIILGLGGCHSSSKVPIDADEPKLPAMIDGASDPMIVKLEKKLTSRGVRVITIGQMDLVSIPSKLLFANESPALNWDSYDLLNDVVCYLQQFRKITVQVNGYSGCYLSERRTYALTLARSRAVANYLWSQNVETRIVFTRGVGDDKPIVSLTKCSDTSPNSRIEITFRRAIA